MAYQVLMVMVSVPLFTLMAAAQLPAGQTATVNAAIEVIVDALHVTKNGLHVSVSYINHLKEPIQFTLTNPPDKAGFASDNLGNEYTLVNATGMIRKHREPNLDIIRPNRPHEHSTFLLAPPATRVTASFQFKRTTELPESKDKPTSISLSISHYARPAEKFDPRDSKHASRAFGFTATITNAKPQG